ncbi:MBL fold metallo-hydrolase [Sodalis sp. dw_96]|uniref:MBL fold metallo-hydrolase n=1 Tax=Sodalis sp. dw_96 TaxID=2719794 RepID=UPI001BD59080|nr:MBL fold metallo-hydrolase [Sodalis sp. dw_96]
MSLSHFAASFGRLPKGPRLDRIVASSNYVGGEFRNQLPTTMFSDGGSYFSSLWDFTFGAAERVKPDYALPVIKTNLIKLDPNLDMALWFGHSSYYLQLAGKRILIDPVFSPYAAPVSFLNKAFSTDGVFSAGDMPEIDYLIISHDHWDHLDYPTMIALQGKIKVVICPLGVGAHLEYWGIAPEIIHEFDWNEQWTPEPDFTLHMLPARHFSGRGPKRNQTLWASVMLETPHRRVFYSGDSGYGPHFARIGDRFGAVDLAIMENGQYDQHWKYIHMMPEETVQAALDVKAKRVLPAHAGRFTLSHHAWDEPYNRIVAASQGKSFVLETPRMGDIVNLERPGHRFDPWWQAEGQAAPA